jgi:hypothetical protein
MATIVLRNVKGSALTFTEMDNNFNNLNEDKFDKVENNYTVTETAGPITFADNDAYAAAYALTTASTGGWETGPHTLEVQFDFKGTNYFSKVATAASGFFSLLCHMDPALAGTEIHGNGAMFGIVDNGTEKAADTTIPVAGLISYFSGTAATNDNQIFLGSDSPPGDPLTDGVQYRALVSSSVDYEDQIWIRYRLFRKNAAYHPDTVEGTAGLWELVWDSGTWLDGNAWVDFTKTGVYLFFITEPSATWSVAFTNIKVSWGPYFPAHIGAHGQLRIGTNKDKSAFIPTTATAADYQMKMTGFTNSTLKTYAGTTFDWGEWCDTNDIKNKAAASSVFSTSESTRLEELIKPLYAILGNLCYHAKMRGW